MNTKIRTIFNFGNFDAMNVAHCFCDNAIFVYFCRDISLSNTASTMDKNIQLNDHKQSCGLASAEGKQACIMPSESKFAEGNAEHPPMHKGEFDISPTKNHATMHR